MATPETRQVRNIPNDRSFSILFFVWNQKLIWLVVMFIAWLAGMHYAEKAGHSDLGIPLGILMFALYYLLIGSNLFSHQSGLAVFYRSANHWVGSLLGARQKASRRPQEGEVVGQEPPGKTKPLKIPQIGRIEFRALDLRGGKMGVAFDRSYGTYSATILCRFSSLFSEGEAEQEARLDGFASLLDSLAESGIPIHRLAWHDQTFFGEHQEPDKTIEAIRRGAQLEREEPPNQQVLADRLRNMSQEAVPHRTLMTLSVAGSEISRQAKAMGGPEAVLAAAVDGFLAKALGEGGRSPIGLRDAEVLTYNNLILQNLLVTDPVYGQRLSQEWAPARNERQMLSQHVAWPETFDFGPLDYCRLGLTYHRCYYLDSFASRGVFPTEFWNLLRARTTKTVSVVYYVVPWKKAIKRAERDKSTIEGFMFDRLSRNRSSRAVHDVDAAAARTQEMEVASRSGQMCKVRCYVDLWGDSPEATLGGVRTLERVTANADFQLKPLDKRQEIGVGAALPLGRGLPTFRTPKWLSWVEM